MLNIASAAGGVLNPAAFQAEFVPVERNPAAEGIHELPCYPAFSADK